MLYVKTPEEVLALIESEFDVAAPEETVSLGQAIGRILACDIAATEYVPDFDRSTVDGYAVRSRDTFGCQKSTASPAWPTYLAGLAEHYPSPPGPHHCPCSEAP